MCVVLAEATDAGVDRLALGTSVSGRPLYESLGFAPKDDEMLYGGEPQRAPGSA